VSDELKSLAESALRGCAANVGPLIGLDLELREVSQAADGQLPQGELAVLPLAAEADAVRVFDLFLASPLEEIATLARRLRDDAEPDKVRDVTPEEQEAVNDVLKLLSGALDQAVRQALGDTLRIRALTWWRTGDPGENALPQGDALLFTGVLQIPSSGTVSVWLNLPIELLRRGGAAPAKLGSGRVVLLGLESELAQTLQRVFSGAQVQVESREPDAEDVQDLLVSAQAIVLSGNREGALELCRRIRCDDATWPVPAIVCLQDPTQDAVMGALESGASHVLALPAADDAILRVLSLAQGT